jgi:hypothetical protein
MYQKRYHDANTNHTRTPSEKRFWVSAEHDTPQLESAVWGAALAPADL